MIEPTVYVVSENNQVYGVYGYVQLLELRLAIVRGEINEQLYYRNEHGGISKIDEFGISDYEPFQIVMDLLRDILKEQMTIRIARCEAENK
jgi:hypothetical protein